MAAAKKKAAPAAPMLHIGVSREAVIEARAAVVAILAVPNVDNKTKVAALESLRSICTVANTTISACTFQTGGA